VTADSEIVLDMADAIETDHHQRARNALKKVKMRLRERILKSLDSQSNAHLHPGMWATHLNVIEVCEELLRITMLLPGHGASVGRRTKLVDALAQVLESGEIAERSQADLSTWRDRTLTPIYQAALAIQQSHAAKLAGPGGQPRDRSE